MNRSTPVRYPDRDELRHGRVVDVLVTAGSTVAAGEEVLLVQDHGRTLRFRSPRAGRLRAIIECGSLPAPGQLLFTLDSSALQENLAEPEPATPPVAESQGRCRRGLPTGFLLKVLDSLVLGALAAVPYVMVTGASPLGA